MNITPQQARDYVDQMLEFAQMGGYHEAHIQAERLLHFIDETEESLSEKAAEALFEKRLSRSGIRDMLLLAFASGSAWMKCGEPAIEADEITTPILNSVLDPKVKVIDK